MGKKIILVAALVCMGGGTALAAVDLVNRFSFFVQ